VRVLRGRAGDVDADRARSEAMLDAVAETGEPAVRVWRPHRQVAFGRRDAREEGFAAAAAAARERGFDPVERSVGGRAVAYTGTTVAFARATPLDDVRTGMDARYGAATADVAAALADLAVDAERGEPDDAFCPGQHSLRAPGGGKLVGLAQRVRSGAAVVAGVAIPTDRAELVDVLDAVYGALGLPFTPESVGSVAAAGGDGDPDAVVAAVESRLVGDRPTTVERVDA
jgi:octanoyl-[GcvH]:protein N-octanoyltransferase